MSTDNKQTSSFIRPLLVLSLAATGLATAATGSTAHAAPVAFAINSTGSSRATFESDAPIENIVGVTTAVTGTLSLDLAAPERGARAEVSVDLTKVKTGIDKRDTHMRSDDFLATRKFPTASFKLTKIEMKERLVAGGNVAAIGYGSLTIKGRSVNVTVPVQLAYRTLDDALRKLKFTGDVLRATASFSIQLSDFGIRVPAMLGQKVSNTVVINVALTSIAK